MYLCIFVPHFGLGWYLVVQFCITSLTKGTSAASSFNKNNVRYLFSLCLFSVSVSEKCWVCVFFFFFLLQSRSLKTFLLNSPIPPFADFLVSDYCDKTHRSTTAQCSPTSALICLLISMFLLLVQVDHVIPPTPTPPVVDLLWRFYCYWSLFFFFFLKNIKAFLASS